MQDLPDPRSDAAPAGIDAALIEKLDHLEQVLSASHLAITPADGIRRPDLLLKSFMDRSDQLAWLKDDSGRLVWANRHWYEQFGLSEAEALGKTDADLLPADEAARIEALERELRAGRDPMRGIEKTVDALGITRGWRVTRFTFRDAGGAAYLGGLATDDTEELRRCEEARHQSITDSLTGLLNRRGFDTLAEPELLRARRRGSSCTLLFIDLDGLRGVNDRLGHAAGDAIISLASMILRKTFRTTDIVARIGGDEFAILAPDTEGTLDSIRARLRHAVEELSANPILEAQFGFSVGLMRCDPEGRESLAQMLHRADRRPFDEALASPA